MNISLMKNLCRATQPRLLNLMKEYLKSKNYKITARKEYIIAEGTDPICLVAHLDTVGDAPPKDIFYDEKEQVMWSPQLLGADDRAGVYAIIQIIEDGYMPSVIFTTDEELGALGSTELVTTVPDCPLENLKAIFQLDRRGANDCVFYDCDNPDFIAYVKKFGFNLAYGSFSDISVIAPAWEVAAANLSVGYYNEHTVAEFLRCNELEDTIFKVEELLKSAKDMPSFVYIEKVYPKNYFRFNAKNCLICNASLDNNNDVLIQDKQPYHICIDCYKTYFEDPKDLTV